ncbi:hypothetical protein AAHK20_09030 [Trinickia sp. YCB016]
MRGGALASGAKEALLAREKMAQIVPESCRIAGLGRLAIGSVQGFFRVVVARRRLVISTVKYNAGLLSAFRKACLPGRFFRISPCLTSSNAGPMAG